MAHPTGVTQWRDYVGALDDSELYVQAKAANSVLFVRTLQEEGCEAEEIHQVMLCFAARLQQVGLRPPGGGFYDFTELLSA